MAAAAWAAWTTNSKQLQRRSLVGAPFFVEIFYEEVKKAFCGRKSSRVSLMILILLVQSVVGRGVLDEPSWSAKTPKVFFGTGQKEVTGLGGAPASRRLWAAGRRPLGMSAGRRHLHARRVRSPELSGLSPYFEILTLTARKLLGQVRL
jgi:hypothetical protein